MSQKLIFTLLSPILGHIHEMKGNLEHLPHEHWPRMSGQIVLKFCKKQMEYKNHKICHDIMISYAEAKVKIWEVFEQVITYTPQKSKHLRKRSKELRSRPEFFWRSFCLDRVRLARVIQGIKDEQATTFLFTRKFLFNTHISSSQPEQWARSCVLRLPWPPDDGRCRLLSASKTSYTLVALAISRVT